jgi:hypothetical protein
MRSYTISKKSIVYSIFYSLIAPIISPLIIGEIYMRLTEKMSLLHWIRENNAGIYVLYIILSLMIPTVFIFLEYFYFNRKTKVEIMNDNSISISNSKGKYESSFENIKECLIIRETKGWAFHTASNFSMARLEFKDGNKFVITCLLEWDLQYMLRGINYIEKRSIYPSISIYRFFNII